VSTAVAETAYTILVWCPGFTSSVFKADGQLITGRRSWNTPVDIFRDVSEAMGQYIELCLATKPSSQDKNYLTMRFSLSVALLAFLLPLVAHCATVFISKTCKEKKDWKV
jgi:hypothetical protein